jgi:signal transduction histidine kinase
MQRFLRFFIFNVIIQFNSIDIALAQKFQVAKHFKIEHGLSSNHVYDILEDCKGFLWLATDKGLSCFDGKYFKNYSVKDGLPSNDVISIKEDGRGCLWVNCFQQMPTCFNRKRNCFEVVRNDSLKALLKNTNFLALNYNNDAVFMNQNYITIATSNKKIKFYKTSQGGFILSDELKVVVKRRDAKAIPITICLFKNDKQIDTITFNDYRTTGTNSWINKNHFFWAHDRCLSSFRITEDNKIKHTIFKSPSSIQHVSYGKNNYILIDEKNHIYIFNEIDNSLNIEIEGVVGATCAWLDAKNQLWIGTKDDGFYCMSQSLVKQMGKDQLHNKYISFGQNELGQIVAGNQFSEVYNTCTNQTTRFRTDNSFIRSILNMKDCYVISDNFFFKNIPVNANSYYVGASKTQAKSAVVINDTIIYLGGIRNFGYLNVNTKKINWSTTDFERCYSPCINSYKKIYFISGSKLYGVQYPSMECKRMKVFFEENESPQSMICSRDDLLWVSTNLGNIYVIKEDVVFQKIKQSESLLDDINHLNADDSTIYISTENGLALLHFTHTPTFSFTLNSLNQGEGLPSQSINATMVFNDSVYVATNNGIGIFPKKFSIPYDPIQPYLQQIVIDNKAYPLNSVCKLNHGSHLVQLLMAGINLTGNLKNMQYALNDTTHWIDMENNKLSIVLQGGESKLYMRAKDNNHRISKTVLACTFQVNIRFYETILFWVLLISTALLFMFWWLQKRAKAKQHLDFEKQLLLQQQRQQITADLHDEIGSTLSSLQLNSAVANKLLDRDVVKAKHVINKIEVQTKNLSEKLGDMIWSMKPGNEEFLNLNSRIKNYANDILGSLEIHYEVTIDQHIDTLLTKVHARKNVLLIIKEAINNAAKYSQSKCILVSLQCNATHIIISIKDNGVSFLPNGKGNGLQTMKMRTEELGGKFILHTSLNQGTEIESIIPITSIRDF